MRRMIRIAWNYLGRLLHVLHLQNVIVIEAEKGTRENTWCKIVPGQGKL